MRSVLRYPGAKWGVADWIVGMMPSHKSYLDIKTPRLIQFNYSSADFAA